MPVAHLAVEAETVEPNTTVPTLARRMRDEDVGDLIVTEEQRPVGIVTDRDITLAVADHGDLDSYTAADVMTADPVTIEGDVEAVELPAQMAESGVRRLPVVDDDGLLTGIATLDDVVAVTGEQLDDVATVIEAQSPEYEP